MNEQQLDIRELTDSELDVVAAGWGSTRIRIHNDGVFQWNSGNTYQRGETNIANVNVALVSF